MSSPVQAPTSRQPAWVEAVQSLRELLARMEGDSVESWEPSAPLLDLELDLGTLEAGGPVGVRQAIELVEALAAKAAGDHAGFERAIRRAERMKGRTIVLPSPVDPQAIRQELAHWPEGLPMADAWALPALRWDAGALSIVAAPTSAGKTTFLLAQILYWLENGDGAPGRILVWSCETPTPLLTARLVGMIAQESLASILDQERQGLLTPAVAQAWQTFTPWANRLVVLDEDMDALSLVEMAEEVANTPDGLAAVVIDYLQELPAVRPDHPDADRYARSREAEVGMVARTLRHLATALQVPVLAAAQFNRVVNKNSDYVPDLLQLRESGRIEQNAGLVIGLRNEIMSQAAQAPLLPKAPSGWAHTGTGERAYSSFVPTDALATARLGAQIAVRDMYGSDHVLVEAFVLKNRWRGHVGDVVPFALHAPSGQTRPIAYRYVPRLDAPESQRPRRTGPQDRPTYDPDAPGVA